MGLTVLAENDCDEYEGQKQSLKRPEKSKWPITGPGRDKTKQAFSSTDDILGNATRSKSKLHAAGETIG